MLQNKPNQPINVDFGNIRIGLVPAVIASVLIALFILYIQMPVLNIRFVGWAFGLAFVLFPLLMVGSKKLSKIVLMLYAVLALYVITALLASAPLFRAKSYRNLLGEVKSTEFSSLISPVNLEQVPTVDRSFATSLAEKKLGDDFALGSRVKLGWPTRQMVRGRLVWVVPLEHSGFFKWITNLSNGTPGYIMVSATDPQDISFVRKLNEKDIVIKYQPSAYFNQNLHRHLYLNGYVTKGLNDYTFEIDEQGEPYWTTTAYQHKIGALGSEAVGLAIVHAGTGAIKYYSMEKTAGGWSDKNIPAWVDRIQPAEFVTTQLNWWGNYVNGFWNTLFGKRDMLMTTEGYNIIYGNYNRSYFYTGMSSVGSDEGTVGFMLTDTRTKQTHFYRLSGATEYAAMLSAEGKVQNFKYRATFPILVNMNGAATYFMTLKDSAGLVKQFAFVSVKDFSVVGVGESIKAARNNFQMTMASSRTGVFSVSSNTRSNFTGTIARIGTDVKDARTHYYIIMAEKPEHIFIATTDLTSYLPLAAVNDKIEIQYQETGDREINLSALRFVELEQKPEEAD